MNKQEGREDLLFEYGRAERKICHRFPNVFGNAPDITTTAQCAFCHNIANGLPIQINDRNTVMNLVYIDDVVGELIKALEGNASVDSSGYCYVPVTYSATLGEIADLIHSFRESRNDLQIPDMADGFTKKLYSTYLSYLPKESFSYPLKMNMTMGQLYRDHQNKNGVSFLST